MDLLNQHCPLFYKDKYEKESLANMNIYISTQKFVFDNTVTGVIVPLSLNRTFLHYFFFYKEDDGLTVLNHVFDAHLYDLEHVVVELTGDTVTGVCYFPHASIESFWIRGALDLNDLLVDGRPKVFSSRGKHASYPVSGTVWRYGGFANDHNDAVNVPITAVLASEQLLALNNFDRSTFPAIKNRIIGDFSTVKTVKLNRARYNMLFKSPKGTDAFIKSHKAALGAGVVSVIIVVTVIVLLLQNKKKKLD